MSDGTVSVRRRQRVVLTGAWGGGKTAFLDELLADPRAATQLLVLPEAAPLARRMGFDVASPRFQAAVVRAQHALEEIAELRDGPADDRLVVSHRGSLDGLAFWRLGGGSEAGFFALAASSRKAELARYDAILHFQTCARGAPDAYERYRQDHPRPPAADAERLDALLVECWSHHPGYCRLVNGPGGWADKTAAARRVLEAMLRDRPAHGGEIL